MDGTDPVEDISVMMTWNSGVAENVAGALALFLARWRGSLDRERSMDIGGTRFEIGRGRCLQVA